MSEKTALIIPDAQNLALLAEAGYGEQLSPFDLDRVRVGGVDALAAPIEGVIVHAQHRRAFFGTLQYSEEGELAPVMNRQAVEGNPPECHSDNGITGYGIPGGECISCPLAQFGSSGDSRAAACKDIRFLYLAKGGELLPTVVQVPPSSLKAYREYYRSVYTGGKPFEGVVTRISLQPTKNAGGVAYNGIAFEKVRDLTMNEANEAKAYQNAVRSVFP